MAARRLPFSLLILSLVLHMSNIAESAVTTTKRPNQKPTTTHFIRSSCKATLYPVACVQSLSGYASAIRQSEKQLAITALSVSVSRAQSCASFVKKMGSVKGMKPREYNVVRGCIENMNDSVERLTQSVREIGLVGKPKGQDFMWHVSNVETWVSAAITDQDTCLDGFDGPHMDPKLKAAIRPRVVDVSHITSNALALVNHYATKYRTTK